MNFKKSFVIKFQRSELLEIEIKKMTQIQEERSKITFAFLDDFNRLDSLKGGTMRQKFTFKLHLLYKIKSQDFYTN